MRQNTYLRNKNISTGAGDSELNLYDLTDIAVDFAKIMRNTKDLKTGWDKLPVNNTRVKEKIVERLLVLKEADDDGIYQLNQTKIINTLQNVRGNNAIDLTPQPNNRLRLFSIIFGESMFRP